MKDGISKFLPFVVGGFIGWLLFNPPAWLRSRGLAAKKVSAQEFAFDFKKAMAKQHEGFRSAPVRHSWVALWRTVSKRHPHNGPLAGQPAAAGQVRKLQFGRQG